MYHHRTCSALKCLQQKPRLTQQVREGRSEHIVLLVTKVVGPGLWEGTAPSAPCRVSKSGGEGMSPCLIRRESPLCHECKGQEQGLWAFAISTVRTQPLGAAVSSCSEGTEEWVGTTSCTLLLPGSLSAEAKKDVSKIC